MRGRSKEDLSVAAFGVDGKSCGKEETDQRMNGRLWRWKNSLVCEQSKGGRRTLEVEEEILWGESEWLKSQRKASEYDETLWK